jgi:hypothetical protein
MNFLTNTSCSNGGNNIVGHEGNDNSGGKEGDDYIEGHAGSCRYVR